MPKYQCPECEAVLKRDMPVAEGKKIKCPKCEVIFKPVAMREAAEPEAERKKAKPVKKAAPAPVDDDDEIGGSYGVAEEKEDDDKEKKKKALNYGSLRDKYAKSKRGPAMAKLINLSNGLLFIGIVLFLASLAGVIVGLWPFVFSENMPRGAAARGKIFQIVGSVLGLVYAGCICFGGSKMHDLESYGWAMAGSIMTAVSGVGTGIAGLVIGLSIYNSAEEDDSTVKMFVVIGILVAVGWAGFSGLVGGKSIARLKEEDVKDGFEETLNRIEY